MARANAEKVFEDLRKAIYSNELKPGDTILEKSHHGSQGTVRTALFKLQEIGLVTRVPNLATRVVNLRRQDVIDLIEARIPLEQSVFRSAQHRLSESAKLRREIASRLEERLEEIGRYVFADEEFHHLVWDQAERPILARTLKQLAAPMFAFVEILRQENLRQIGERVRAHQTLLHALLSKNTGDVSRAVANHVRETYASFLTTGIPDLGELAHRSKATVLQPPVSAEVPKHHEFLRWAPAMVLVLDSNQRFVYVNETFERCVETSLEKCKGQQLRDPFWLRVNQIAANEDVCVIAVEKRGGRQQVALCFPMHVRPQDGGKVDIATGGLGLNIAELADLLDAGVPAEVRLRAAPREHFASKQHVPKEVFVAFFNGLPAVTTWKDLQGRLLWANPAYLEFTNKKLEDVFGNLPTENWPNGPGQLIMSRDKRVRETQAPYLTTDCLKFGDKEHHRLTIRFPSFDSESRLTGTASLGLNYDLMMEGLRQLKDLPDGASKYARLTDRVRVTAWESFESSFASQG